MKERKSKKREARMKKRRSQRNAESSLTKLTGSEKLGGKGLNREFDQREY